MLTLHDEDLGRKSGLGSMMAGGNPKDGRQEDDFYPSPPEVARALLQVEHFPGRVWEPCGGDGAIVDVLRQAGYKDIIASDLNPRAPGVIKRDLFTVTKPVAHSIITNPPFQLANDKDAADVIEHLLSLRPAKLALMLKSSYWHARSRLSLFDKRPPVWIYPLTWRPDFRGLGRPVMEVSWVVWHAGNVDFPRYRPLMKPLPPPKETRATPDATLAI